MAREFTRQTFYDLVWSKPITHVAKDFALSDVAIHKICRKHGIPTPPLGWWAKKQAGKPVRHTALPRKAAGSTDRIVIAAPELRAETDEVATVREEARVRVSAPPGDPIPSNAFVRASLTALRRAAPSHKGLIEVSGPGLIRCAVGVKSLDRLELVLSQIVAAASVQGFELEGDGRGVHFVGDGETIGFNVTESVERVKHVPTAQEQRLLDAWRRKNERRNRGASWDDVFDYEPRPHVDEWDWVCTGRLGFEMETVRVLDRQGPRSTFRDAKIQRLDDMAADISIAMAVLAVSKRQEAARLREAERARIEARRIREQPLRAKYVADRRREALEAVLSDLASLDRLRRLLSGLDALQADAKTLRVATFVDCARAELAAREAAFSAEGLETRFAEQRLFGADDDHSFKSPAFY